MASGKNVSIKDGLREWWTKLTVSGEESDGGTHTSGTSSTADTVDVILRVVGVVIVEHVSDVLDVLNADNVSMSLTKRTWMFMEQ